MEEQDLQALLEKARSADRTAFDALCRTHMHRLESWIRAHLGAALRGKIEPQDVLQETLLRAFQSIRSFRGTDVATFFSWLSGIAEHHLWSLSQKRSLQEGVLAVEIPGASPTASKQLRRKERLERLEDSLSHLPADQKEAIVLAKIDGLKIQEIASRMGRSEGAVKQLIWRGLRGLRKTFGDTESLHLPERDLEGGGGRGA